MKIKAFTLVEILIVVTILGILAAVVLPTFQGQTAIARESSVKDSLSTMRTQIEFYKMEHDGVPPGYANGNPVGEMLLEFPPYHHSDQGILIHLLYRQCIHSLTVPENGYPLTNLRHLVQTMRDVYGSNPYFP